MKSVGGWAALSPLFQLAPLISCGRRFCPSCDIWCSCDLYSTPQPLSFFLPSCPVCFNLLVALSHCPFVSCTRAVACVEKGQSLSKRSVILSWGEWACWGIREGAVGGSKKEGTEGWMDWRGSTRMSVTARKWAPRPWWNTMSQPFHPQRISTITITITIDADCLTFLTSWESAGIWLSGSIDTASGVTAGPLHRLLSAFFFFFPFGS